ncbi:MAG: GNAT family N-acetyltransferase [Micromonosporaceae bacterium]
MVEVRTVHTADLDTATLAAARALLDEAFGGDFRDHDWDHTLGGVHALVWEGDELVGHGAVVQRRLLYGGRAVRTGYVEGVGVRADRRGRGLGAAVMTALELVVAAGYELGALSSTGPATGFYLARGWRRWQGPTWALTPAGVVRTAQDDGSVFVLPVSGTWDLSRPLTCDWRDGDLW